MNKRNCCHIVCVFLFATVFSVEAASINKDASTLSQAAKVALHTDIELTGGASVIVEYKEPITGRSSAVDSQTNKIAIQSLHRNFANSLSNAASKSITSTFTYVPAAVLSVNKKQLKEVSESPYIKKIYQNKVRRINLQESVDLVLPGRAKDVYSGKGQAIAIIDTGVDRNHEFFLKNGVSRVVSEACYSGGGFRGFREVVRLCPDRSAAQTGVGAGIDCTGFNFPGCNHGTHVAGIAAGNDGVANEADIIAIQVFTGLRDVFSRNVCRTDVGRSCTVAFDSDIIKGLERVFELRNTHKIAAVNMSLGGGQFSGTCDSENRLTTNIIRQLKSAGIATIVSSGNNGYAGSISQPACISDAIAVGATSDFTGFVLGEQVVRDERVFYSNHGTALDLFGPGTQIRSSVPGNRFADLNGTSMAAPHVAGAFAVVKAQQNSLTVDTIENTFKSVGPNISHAGISRRRIDIPAALRELGLFNTGFSMAPIMLLLDDAPTASQSPAPEPPAGCSIPTINFRQTVSDSWSRSSAFSANRDGSRSKLFVFELSEATAVDISLTSNADTYLYLMSGCGANGAVIDENDDDDASLNSRIRQSLEAGIYTIDATTFSRDDFSTFLLRLTN